MSKSNCPPDCRVYVGDLGEGMTVEDLRPLFSKYGRLRNVWVARNPPGFAFVEFEDPRDAEDAVRSLDGTKVAGVRIRVEISQVKPKRRDNYNGGNYNSRDRGSGGRSGGYATYDRDRRSPPRKRDTRRISRSHSRGRRSRSKERGSRR